MIFSLENQYWQRPKHPKTFIDTMAWQITHRWPTGEAPCWVSAASAAVAACDGSRFVVPERNWGSDDCFVLRWETSGRYLRTKQNSGPKTGFANGFIWKYRIVLTFSLAVIQNDKIVIVAVAHAIARRNHARVSAKTHSRYYTKARNKYILTHTYISSISAPSDVAAVSKQYPARSSPSTSVSSYSSVHTWHTSKWCWLVSTKTQLSLHNSGLLCDLLPPWPSPPSTLFSSFKHWFLYFIS